MNSTRDNYMEAPLYNYYVTFMVEESEDSMIVEATDEMFARALVYDALPDGATIISVCRGSVVSDD